MNTKRYVQHISGQGEKWEVLSDNCHETEWRVKARTHEFYHDIPKSEYRLCESPEEWEDVSGSYEADQVPYDVLHYNDLRLRKIDHLHNGPAFIVERRKS